jgi:predicted exporter
MLVCWATTYVLAPVLTRQLAGSLSRQQKVRGPALAEHVARWVVARPRSVLGLVAFLFIGSVLGLASRRADWLETDFSRLRRSDSFETGERYWGKRMDATLRRYLTPTVVLTDSLQQAEQVAVAARRAAAEGRAGGLIASVRSASDVLPQARGDALLEAQRLGQLVTGSMLDGLKPEHRAFAERALSDAALTPLVADDVPTALAAGLRDMDGRLDRNVLIFPVPSALTWDAERLEQFSHEVRGLVRGVDPGAVAAGPLLLSSDIIEAMRRDGPRATIIALVAAVLVTLVAFRSVRLSLLALGSLGLGVVLMLGAAAWAGQRLNFSNFVALPITFGIAADYAINVLKRYQSGADVAQAVANTGGAVALCSVATVIGFGSLLVANNQALFSFGVLAVAGELSSLCAAVLIIPAFLGWREARSTAYTAVGPGGRLGLDS